MERLIELLQEIKEDIDFENETALIDDELLDSFDILQLISAIDDEFEVATAITAPTKRAHITNIKVLNLRLFKNCNIFTPFFSLKISCLHCREHHFQDKYQYHQQHSQGGCPQHEQAYLSAE